MARYGRPEERIHRILNRTTLSRGVTRWNVAAILALGAPLAYVVAAARPESAPQTQATAAAAAVPAMAPQPASDGLPADQSAQSSRTAKPESATAYLTGLGNVTPFNTVNVKSRVDGQLMSVSFNEGQLVQAGQVLATIDAGPYKAMLADAEGQLARDQPQLESATRDVARLRGLEASQLIAPGQLANQLDTVRRFEGIIASDQAKVEYAKLQLVYTQITAPITGVAGLRLLGPGNIVHATDPNGIVIITQLQPIAVLFTIPEDGLPQVLARLREGGHPPVEAWNRDNTAKIATGNLTAVDNQIDPETGMARLKAVFDNKDGALFPNQFVNVRLFVNPE